MCAAGTAVSDFDTIYKKICADLSRQGQVSDLTKEFNTLYMDESRVRFVLTLDAVRLPPIVTRAKLKCAAECQRLRALGNGAYRRGEDSAALELYTAAVLAAPAEDTEGTEPSLALALANRSAVLLSLGHLGPCVADMQRALQAGYPQQLRPKLQQRLQKVRAALEEHHIHRLPLAQLQSTNNNVELQEDDWFIAGDYSPKSAPELDSVNESMPSASAQVEMRETVDRGRYLAAKLDIEPGQVLVVERPYSAVLLPEHAEQHCHHCCRWCPAPISCLHCAEVRFCSGRCRSAAWRLYHGVECAICPELAALDVGQIGLLAVRTVVVAGWSQLMQLAVTRPEKVDAGPVYRSDDYQRVRQLVGHTTARSSGDLFKRTLMAVLLGRLLERTPLFPAGLSALDQKQGLVLVSAEILRHLQTLPCNAHEVSEQLLPAGRVSGATTLQTGAAVFPVLSLTNHACEPNVFRGYYGTTAVLRALRHIPAGHEILDNYGYHYAVMGRPERRRGLERQYYFTCGCSACAADLPLYDRIPAGAPSAVCDRCAGEVTTCGHVTDPAGYVQEVQRAGQQLLDSVLAVLAGRGAEVRDTIGQLIALLSRRVRTPWRDLNDAEEAFKMSFLVDGNICPVESGGPVKS